MSALLLRRAAVLTLLAACQGACSNETAASSEGEIEDGGGHAGHAAADAQSDAPPPSPPPDADAGGCGPGLSWPILPSTVSLPAPFGYTTVFAGCGFVGVARPTTNGAVTMTSWYDAETGAMVCDHDLPDRACDYATCLPHVTGGCTRADLGLEGDGGPVIVEPPPAPDAGTCGPLDCSSAPCPALAWPIGPDLQTIAGRLIANTSAFAGCGFVGVTRTVPSGWGGTTWYDAETGAVVGRSCLGPPSCCSGEPPPSGCKMVSCHPFETGGCTRADLGLEDAPPDGG